MNAIRRVTVNTVWKNFLRGSLTLALAGVTLVNAHAVLVTSQPASNTNVKGPTFPVVLTFNSRVDQRRSTLTLNGPDQVKLSLEVKKDSSAPEKLLTTVSGVKSGPYTLQWQVLSVDGHITRGQVSFTVQ